MSNEIKSYLAMLIQSVSIGFSFLFINIALKSTNTINLLAHRFTVTLICMILFMLFKKENLKIKMEDLKRIAPLSLAFPIIFFLNQTVGYTMVTSSQSGIIYALTPILTFVFAKIFIKEKNNLKQFLFMILSILGIAFINLMKDSNSADFNLLGNIIILISAGAFGIYNVFVRKIASKYSPIQIAYVVNLCGFVFFNVVAVGDGIMNKNLHLFFNGFTNVEFLISLFYLSVITTFLTMILVAFSLSHLESTTVSLFQNVTTVVNILVGVFIFGDLLTIYDHIGIIAVLIGTIGFNLARNKGNSLKS